MHVYKSIFSAFKRERIYKGLLKYEAGGSHIQPVVILTDLAYNYYYCTS